MIILLRKCNHCGLEANTYNDLILFKKDYKGKYGRENTCKACFKIYKAKHQRQYRKTIRGKAKHLAYNAKRRALKKGTAVDNSKFENEVIEMIYKYSKYLSDRDGIKYHVDHIIPISKGGKHHPLNLQIITAEENMRKGDKIIDI